MRLTQVAVRYTDVPGTGVQESSSGGGPAASHFLLPPVPGTEGMTAATFDAQLKGNVAFQVAANVVGNGNRRLSAAQQAVLSVLSGVSSAQARDLGIDRGLLPAPGSAALAAAQRFATVPAAARHTWLAAHLTALRAGQVTPADLP